MNGNEHCPAQMSVVLVTPNRYENIRKTMEHLLAQTVRDQLEIVIVAPSAAALNFNVAELTAFSRVQVVEIGEIRSTGKAVASGVRASIAPIVTYAEEHAYPDPGWAEALIEAHRQSWAAVGVMIIGANPSNMISWANYFTDFAPFGEDAEAGEMSHLAWHNTAYQRALLLEYGPELDAMLETEGVLHQDLHAKGHRLYFAPKAKTNHVNISLLSSYRRAQFHGARMFAANRARIGKWSIAHRLLYTCAMPLISLVRLKRVLRLIVRSGRARELFPRILPVLIIGLTADGLGQLVGYASGAGDAAQRLVSFQLHRYQHITQQDRMTRRVFSQRAMNES